LGTNIHEDIRISFLSVGRATFSEGDYEILSKNFETIRVDIPDKNTKILSSQNSDNK
jgi:hypothetical protein